MTINFISALALFGIKYPLVQDIVSIENDLISSWNNDVFTIKTTSRTYSVNIEKKQIYEDNYYIPTSSSSSI